MVFDRRAFPSVLSFKIEEELTGIAKMTEFRVEKDSMGEIEVPADKLWGAQTQRSLQYFSSGDNLIPREMIDAYAVLKKAAAIVNFRKGRLSEARMNLIGQVCDEILAGEHRDHFPLYVWMTGSGTQFNMNVNEVIANRCSQLTGHPLGSKTPVDPNDHVNMSQSTNDSFPSAMYIATADAVKTRLIPSLQNLLDALQEKAILWQNIVKIGRTHLQDATPLTLGQEFSGYVGLLEDGIDWIDRCLEKVYRLSLGGTAVGTGINAPIDFDVEVAAEIARLTGLPFVTAPNKFTVQGSHDALVFLSGGLKTIATSLYKIANDIRFLSCGPRCGIGELHLPENEPGSSIMPGKVNPTQCEALSMIAIQAIANDVAVTLGGAAGHLEMNVYKPLLIHNLMQSIGILADGCRNFTEYTVRGMVANTKQIETYVDQSLMLVTALSPVIGYQTAAKVAHHALHHDLTLKEATLALTAIDEEEYDRIVDPTKMVNPYVAGS
jgi:fumarate hydratase, class II